MFFKLRLTAADQIAAHQFATAVGTDELLATGAGLIVVMTGDILTMPGLPKVPAAEKIDVDENGKITATDYSILNHALLGINELNGAYFKAADLYEDDKITASDISILNKAILGVYELVYKKPNK